MRANHVAIVCDLREENWPSMDLVADMLLGHLRRDYSELFNATRICPPMRRRLSKQRSEVRDQKSEIGSHRSDFRARLFNADRVLNRFWDYPRFVRGLESEVDLFHVIDHSYGQLLHELPPERTVITCHDLDTFQCLLNPAREPRSIFFRKMMSRTLSGLRQAARVTCVSHATRDELLAHGLVEPQRVVVIANGVAPSCSPNPDPVGDAQAEAIIGGSEGYLDILHVGSTIPRKRIDLLLRIFASVKDRFPTARLLRVGGPLTAEQALLADKLDLGESMLVLSHLDRNVLAAIYRRAALVLQPSEREGFGLPVVEAMACGTPVVASDLPVLREVGGDAAVYCEMGNVETWTEMIAELLKERYQLPELWAQRREAGLVQAAKFSWAEYARRMVAVYQSMLR
jgi:glycosyltransferase involved in cell wall biosynthesis